MAFPLQIKDGYKIKLILCFIILFIFGAFRYDFGLDYVMYEEIFRKIKTMHNFVQLPTDRTEIGYRFLNYISPSFQFIVIVSSALICISYYYLFSRYVSPKFGLLGIFLFYLCGNDTVFFMFSGIRNGIALSIFILSIPLIEKRRLVKYICITILAGLIHQSAFIVFPVAYAMGYIKKITPKVSISLICVAIILAITPFDLMLSASSKFVLANFDRYASYIESAQEIGTGASAIVILSNLCLIASICVGLRNKIITRKNTALILISLLGCYAPFLGPLNLRLSIFFTAISIVALTIILPILKKDAIRYLIIGLFIVYHAYSFFIVWLGNPHFPYSEIHNFVFEEFTRL